METRRSPQEGRPYYSMAIIRLISEIYMYINTYIHVYVYIYIYIYIYT